MAVLIGDAQRPPEGPSGRHLVANDCPRTSPEAVSGRILAARTIFMPKPNVNRISSLTDSVGIEIRLTFVVWEEAWRSSPSENNTSELPAHPFHCSCQLLCFPSCLITSDLDHRKPFSCSCWSLLGPSLADFVRPLTAIFACIFFGARCGHNAVPSHFLQHIVPYTFSAV